VEKVNTIIGHVRAHRWAQALVALAMLVVAFLLRRVLWAMLVYLLVMFAIAAGYILGAWAMLALIKRFAGERYTFGL
jgi:hypothetical protein